MYAKKKLIVRFDGKHHVATVEGTSAYCIGHTREQAIANLVLVFPHELGIKNEIHETSLEAQPYALRL